MVAGGSRRRKLEKENVLKKKRISGVSFGLWDLNGEGDVRRRESWRQLEVVVEVGDGDATDRWSNDEGGRRKNKRAEVLFSTPLTLA